jgi:hypothetical protein
MTGSDVELAERVAALLDELEERFEVYVDAGQGSRSLALAVAWVAGRHDLDAETEAKLLTLYYRRRPLPRPHHRHNGRRGPGEGTA